MPICSTSDLVAALHAAGLRRATAQRFAAKVDLSDPDGCWPWTAGRTEAGYGVFGIAGTSVSAHVVTYSLLVGPLVEDVDHAVCNNPPCVNPFHLEAVTHAENLRRRDERAEPVTHCSRGHEFTPDNTYVYVNSRNGRLARQCRACNRERDRARRSS